LHVLPEAEEELAAAATWYESKRAGLGVALLVTVDRAFEEICDAPTSHALWRADRSYRRKVLKRFPYVVFFQMNDDAALVVAVAHAKCRPGYWVGRGRP
jgi:plasmid stabilization system protein ParE